MPKKDIEQPSTSNGGHSAHQLNYIQNVIVAELWKHKYAWPFKQPVNVNLPNYYEAILKPMDLGTIKGNLRSNHYSNATHAIDDIVLMFRNCLMYNGHTDDVVIMAKQLIGVFANKLKAMQYKNEPLPQTATCSSASVLDDTGPPVVVIPKRIVENYGIKVPRAKYTQDWKKRKPVFLKRTAPEIFENNPARKRGKSSEEPQVIF